MSTEIPCLINCHKLDPDPPPLRDADRYLVLSTGQRANQDYQEVAPGRAWIRPMKKGITAI